MRWREQITDSGAHVCDNIIAAPETPAIMTTEATTPCYSEYMLGRDRLGRACFDPLRSRAESQPC